MTTAHNNTQSLSDYLRQLTLKHDLTAFRFNQNIHIKTTISPPAYFPLEKSQNSNGTETSDQPTNELYLENPLSRARLTLKHKLLNLSPTLQLQIFSCLPPSLTLYFSPQ